MTSIQTYSALLHHAGSATGAGASNAVATPASSSAAIRAGKSAHDSSISLRSSFLPRLDSTLTTTTASTSYLPPSSPSLIAVRSASASAAGPAAAIPGSQSQNGAVRDRVIAVPDFEADFAPEVNGTYGKGGSAEDDAAAIRGGLIDGGLVYRERFVIRCYEVGVNRKASMETIANLLQEIGCNHAQSVGFSNDGFATTPAMLANRLIWVTTRMHIEMYEYPKWGDVVEIDTWFQDGTIMSRRDWIIRFGHTGEVIGRGTSSWAMMNRDTRRLSKVPAVVRAELTVHCPNPERFSIPKNSVAKINKLEEPADHVRPYLRPRRSDLDMNHHVNNVTYIAWMLESLPQSLLGSYELAEITIEYRRECGQDDVVETLAKEIVSPEVSPEVSPGGGAAEKVASRAAGSTGGSVNGVAVLEGERGNGSLVVAAGDAEGVVEAGQQQRMQQFLHLLRSQECKTEINKGRTIWRKKSLSDV
ncbi:unnamed protein product [Closterium sp. Yama58-4]|nr:unnamed protein product [Closterium sp. Yama58-4]